MRHKLGVVMLALLLTAASASEASRQFGEWKSSVAEWTRASILGNMLVFAASDAETSDAEPQTVLLAETFKACKGATAPATAQPSRPASRTKAASTEHAKMTDSLPQSSVAARDTEELASSLTTTRDAKSRARVLVRVVPDVSEIARTLGSDFDEHAVVEAAFRARESGEAGAAARTRAFAELKKLGLRKVYVRVAKMESAHEGVKVFEMLSPVAPPRALEPDAPAFVRGVMTLESAPEATPIGAALPVDQSSFINFFDDPASLVSPGCESHN